jgi:hypothetical protein
LNKQAGELVGSFLVAGILQVLSDLDYVVGIDCPCSDHMCEEGAQHALSKGRIHLANDTALKAESKAAAQWSTERPSAI